jgi:hypothetical protein
MNPHFLLPIARPNIRWQSLIDAAFFRKDPDICSILVSGVAFLQRCPQTFSNLYFEILPIFIRPKITKKFFAIFHFDRQENL